MSKGDQLKWQSARFAFERHRDRYPDSPISFSLQLFSLPIATQVFCAKQKRLENRRIEALEFEIAFSNQFFFTIIFGQLNTSFLCQTEKVGEQKNSRGISSSGRALDSHSRGTGIDTRILQLVFLYNYFRCQLQHKFFVPNRKGWRIEKMCKGDQLKWQSARFAFERHRDRDTDTPIGYSLQLFSLPISTQVCCAKQKRLKNRNKYPKGDQLKWQSAGFAFERHRDRDTDSNWLFFTIIFIANFNASLLCQTEKGEKKQSSSKWQSARFAFERHRDRYPDSPISFSLQLFSLPIATQVFCAKQKRLENRTNMQGGLAQVVERSIRIRQAPGWRPGYSNWLFFTIIFIANFNASFLCQTEKVGEQKKCPRGISSSGRALDSHSRGTGIDTRILQLVGLFSNCNTSLLCQTEKVEEQKQIQGGLAQVVERSIRIREAPGSRHGYSNWLFFTIIFIANFNASLLCQTEKVGEQKKCTRGISSSGRALDSHSRGTGIDTRILQLVFLYNYFRCQLQHKFFVPNRKGWRIEQICKGDQLKWQSARFAFDRHRDGDPDTPIGYSLQ